MAFGTAKAAADALYDRLIASRDFTNQVEAATELFERSHPKTVAEHYAGEPHKVIAERIVNKVDAVPDYQGDATFWNSHRRFFEPFHSWPEAQTLRGEVASLLRATKVLGRPPHCAANDLGP